MSNKLIEATHVPHGYDCHKDSCRRCAQARRYVVLHERINALAANANILAIAGSLDWDSFERRFQRTFQDEFSSRGVPRGIAEQIDWMDRALKAESKLATLQTLLQSFGVATRRCDCGAEILDGRYSRPAEGSTDIRHRQLCCEKCAQ